MMRAAEEAIFSEVSRAAGLLSQHLRGALLQRLPRVPQETTSERMRSLISAQSLLYESRLAK